MGRLAHGCLITLAVGCVSFIVLTLPFRLYGQIVLNNELATLRALEIPTTLEDYQATYPRPFDGRDATEEYLEFCREIDLTLNQVEGLVGDRFPIIGWDHPGWPCWHFTKLEPAVRKAFLQVMTEKQPTLDRLATLVQERMLFDRTRLYEALHFTAGGTGGIPSRIMELAAIAEAERNRPDRSMAFFSLALLSSELGTNDSRLAEACPSLLQFWRTAGMFDALLNRTAFNWNDLKSIQSQLLMRNSESMLEQIISVHVCSVREEYSRYTENPLHYRTTYYGVDYTFYTYATTALAKLADLIGFVNQAEARNHRDLRTAHKAARLPIAERTLSIDLVLDGGRVPWLGVEPEYIVTSGYVRTFMVMSLERIRNVIAISCGVEMYFIDHGTLPTSLDNLTPGYVPQVLLDPETGEPYHYETYKDGYKICSLVGERRPTNSNYVASCSSLPDLMDGMIEVHRPDLRQRRPEMRQPQGL